jgi:methionyl-tRNA formyltransferase
LKLRVVFAGTPVFALPALQTLLNSHDVVGVLTQPDRPAGRGRVLTASPIKIEALAHSLPLLQPQSLRSNADLAHQVINQIHSWQPDVMVVVAYGLMLPQALLDLPRFGCLNIHASLLPRWRGAAPIQRAILAGDARTGVSIMRMEAGLDTGPVFRRADIAIGSRTTAGELHDQLAALGAQQISMALDDCIGARAAAVAQPSDGVTHAAKLSKAEAPIDWTQDAARIDRQIRAFNPWPVAETLLRGEAIRILRSSLADAERERSASVRPGTANGLRGDALEIACGRGTIHIHEMQRSGRKPVSACDFMNAEQLRPGQSLVFA